MAVGILFSRRNDGYLRRNRAQELRHCGIPASVVPDLEDVGMNRRGSVFFEGGIDFLWDGVRVARRWIHEPQAGPAGDESGAADHR
jgi:hypothetical protein